MKIRLAAALASLTFLVLAAGCAADPSEPEVEEETSSQADAVTTCGSYGALCGTGKPACCSGFVCRAQMGCSGYRCPKYCLFN